MLLGETLAICLLSLRPNGRGFRHGGLLVAALHTATRSPSCRSLRFANQQDAQLSKPCISRMELRVSGMQDRRTCKKQPGKEVSKPRYVMRPLLCPHHDSCSLHTSMPFCRGGVRNTMLSSQNTEAHRHVSFHLGACSNFGGCCWPSCTSLHPGRVRPLQGIPRVHISSGSGTAPYPTGVENPTLGSLKPQNLLVVDVQAETFFGVELLYHHDTYETLFVTEDVREFCATWKVAASALGTYANCDYLLGPTADDFIAWLPG